MDDQITWRVRIRPDPAETAAPEIGSSRTFIPATDFGGGLGHAWANQHGSSENPPGATPVTAVCVYVNREHRFARYAWDTSYGLQHECFKY